MNITHIHTHILLFEDSSGEGLVNSNWTRVGRSMLENSGSVVFVDENQWFQHENAAWEGHQRFSRFLHFGHLNSPRCCAKTMDKFNLVFSCCTYWRHTQLPEPIEGRSVSQAWPSPVLWLIRFQLSLNSRRTEFMHPWSYPLPHQISKRLKRRWVSVSAQVLFMMSLTLLPSPRWSSAHWNSG